MQMRTCYFLSRSRSSFSISFSNSSRASLVPASSLPSLHTVHLLPSTSRSAHALSFVPLSLDSFLHDLSDVVDALFVLHGDLAPVTVAHPPFPLGVLDLELLAILPLLEP